MEPHQVAADLDLALLDSLLRGEISAAETYKQALEGAEDGPEVTPLRSIQQDHGEAIHFLYDRVSSHGGEPSVHSGVWGYFARVVEATAAKLGSAAALEALRGGEYRGLSSYRSALRSDKVPADVREHFERVLIPRQRRHIDVLTRLLANH